MTGDMGGGDFRALRHHDGNARAARHLKRLKKIGQPVGVALQLRIGDRAMTCDLIVYVDGDAFTVTGPARAAPVRDIEILRNMPAEFAVQRIVLVSRGLAGHGGPLIMVARCYRPYRRLASTPQALYKRSESA